MIIYRQSGYVHAEKIVTGTGQDALAVPMATFRRAKIDAVHVGANSDSELRVGRLYHDHRGRAEGKKIGKAHITLIERIERELPVACFDPPPSEAKFEPTITLQPIGITCDCGERIEIAFADVRAARTCDACGKDATLTPAQVAQLQTAADEARAEAMAGYRAGEIAITVERRSKLVEDQASTKIGVPPADGI